MLYDFANISIILSDWKHFIKKHSSSLNISECGGSMNLYLSLVMKLLECIFFTANQLFVLFC